MSILTPNVMDVNDDLAKAVAAATTPEALNAAVKAEFDKQVAAATAAETQTAVDAKAAADAVAAKTAADAEAAKVADAAKTAAVNQPTLLSRTEVVGGVEMEFTGATEAEIDKNIINAFKVAAAVRQPERQEDAVDPAVAAQVAVDAAAARAAATAELELKFKRGEIGATEFIEQSGAVKDYLEKQGVPLEALRASVEREQGKAEEKSWAEVTTQFLNSPEGRTWPGGTKNQNMIGIQLAALGLTDATDRVAAIAQAFAKMKELDLVFPGEKEERAAAEAAKLAADPAAQAAAKLAADAAAAKATADAAAAAEAAKNPAKKAPTASAMFGASSGVGAASDAAAGKATEPLIAVPSDATPEQILEAWKAAQVKAGVHPNDAFKAQFSGKRA